MYLIRKQYLKKIEAYIWKKLIKVIVWQRRVWKTILMQQLIKKFKQEEVIYINKEDKDFDFLYNDDVLNDFLEEKIWLWKNIFLLMKYN